MEVFSLEQICQERGIQLLKCIYMNQPKSVYTALHCPSQLQIVLKIQQFSIRDSAPELMKEIDTMKQLTHPNIVTYYESFWFYSSAVTWDVVIVMEKAETDLMGAVMKQKQQGKHWSDYEVLGMAYDLVDALAYCELKGKCHRDIKLQNILFDQGKVKIADFGISKMSMSEVQSHTICGSIAYLSPILRNNYNKSGTAQHNPYKSDVYSLGVTLFSLCNLGLPAQLFSDAPCLQSAVGSLPYCDTVKALLAAMLESEENLRPSYNQIQAALAVAFGYNEACPHIAEGLEVYKVTECHGQLCQYCYFDTNEGGICRLCLIPEEINGPKGNKGLESSANSCPICNNPGELPFCGLHMVCSEQCVVAYCQQSRSAGPIHCPVCFTLISEEILSSFLSNSLIDGLTVSCLRCNSVNLVAISLILACNKHALCQKCVSEMDVTYPTKCPKCENFEILAKGQNCAKCQNIVQIKNIFRFECSHLICKNCIETGEILRCPLCLLPCEVCKRRFSLKEITKQACGHSLCPPCRQVPCSLCFTYCVLCRGSVPLCGTFPLECGLHSLCLSHAKLIPCSLCPKLARN